MTGTTVVSTLMVRKWIAVFCLTAIILAVFVVGVGAAPPRQQGGEAIFQQKCAACHTIGGGTLVGPDLSGVTNLRDVDWLTRWLSAPDKMLADGDPIAIELLKEFNNIPMPNLGLTDAEVADLIAYMQAQDGGAVTVEPAAAQPEVISQPPGDPDAGSQLFIGERALANGGPACISCHSVDTVRGLGGGTLGPNLTHVYGRFGDAGLSASLKGLPFPTMQGVFSKKPLTDDEVADLHAFFSQADRTTQKPISSTGFFILGILGTLVFLGLSQLIWIKRLNGVRKPLVGR